MIPAADDSKSIDSSKVDWDRVDDCALALLYFGLHEDYRTWKGFDRDTMNRLHAKGYISDPVGKAQSAIFTEEGITRSVELA